MMISAEKWKSMIEEAAGMPDQELAEFIRKHPVSIQEPPISQRVSGWIIEGKQSLIERFSRRRKGEKPDSYLHSLEVLMIQDRIQKLVAGGVKVGHAFSMIAGEPLPLSKRYVSCDRVRNMYYSKKKPVLTVREEKDSFMIDCYPTRIEVNGHRMYGHWTWEVPKPH